MRELDNHSLRVRWVLFAISTVALAATLVTCKSVTDSVLAPREPATLAANCMSKCKHDADDDDRDEDDRHKHMDNGCKGDAGCHKREADRHRDADDHNKKKRKKCQDDCHHQGGGKGGR